jgi:acetate kinase
MKRILSIDRGSSSLKFAVYEIESTDERRAIVGGIEPLGAANATLLIRDERGAEPREARRPLGSAAPVDTLLAALREFDVPFDAVGHRLVYGGAAYEAPQRVSDDLLRGLAALVPFDPLHMSDALATIREIAAALPALPQAVCFDTAFHRRMPAVAQRFPLPRELWSEGIRRYGFHGLSYESIVSALGEDGVRGRMIVAHLGNGASLAAVRDGKPMDTTMGLTPLGGIMMGTRPGDLDPGVLLSLLRERRYTIAELDEILTRKSGLLGVSQISADVRTLLNRRDEPAAAEAIELFVYLAKKAIGALTTVLGGLDTFVFTGGIGEHAVSVRSDIVMGLAYLGIELDPKRNAANAPVISADGSRVVVRVIPANETLMVARHSWDVLFLSSSEDAKTTRLAH